MNEKRKDLLKAMTIPSIVWIILAYFYYGYLNRPSSGGMQGVMGGGGSETFPLWLFLVISLISCIGWTAIMYIWIKNYGFVFSKKK